MEYNLIFYKYPYRPHYTIKKDRLGGYANVNKSTAELIKEYDLMSLENVKQYIGIFTGKTVKSSPGWEDKLKEFHKEEKVVYST